MTESGIWTVLPNGFDEDRGLLRATLFFSPRLRNDGPARRPLTDFPLVSHWPEVVRDLGLLLDLDALGVVEAKWDEESLEPSPDVWAQVFRGVEVVDHAFTDLSDRTVHSFPANDVARDLLGTYADVGSASPTALPPVTVGPLADFARDLAVVGDAPRELHPMLDRLRDAEQSAVVEKRRGRYVTRGALASLGRRGPWVATQRFYDRYRDGTRLRTEGAGGQGVVALPPPERPPVDFHAYVGALGDYPRLLRLLGLAVDVVLEPPANLKGVGRVRLDLRDAPEPWLTDPAATPWTMWEEDRPRWLPRSERQRPGYLRGQVNFHSERYWVHQVDIDGSILKALNAASSLATQRDTVQAVQDPSLTADEGSLPALRGAGFTVVRSDRAAAVVASLDHALARDTDTRAGTRVELWAEDVVRGYRLDVDKDGAGFRSLCARVGDYSVRRADGSRDPLDLPQGLDERVWADEGYVKGASTTTVPGDADLYLHEAVLSWSGWSLVAPRPGRRLDPDEELTDAPLEGSEDVPLVTAFRPQPHSLTPLRYGSAYRLRVRLVDLAGNSVEERALTEDEVSDKEPFLRWEPVPAPAVLERRGFGEGESQLRLVVRSTLGLTPGEYVALPRVTGLAGHTTADTAYAATDTRWVVPPRTSVQMAEYHGVLDAAFGPGAGPADVAAQYAVAAREGGHLPERGPEDGLALPYLPDVSSRAAAFAGLPGVAAATLRTPWPSDDPAAPWWDRQPFRLEIAEGPAAAPVVPVGGAVAPDWDAAARVLRVAVPQAEIVRVRLSSGLDPRDLDVQGGWSLLRPRVPASVRAAALDGRVWMVSPSLEVTLVHAVEKPLAPPRVAVPQAGMERRPGEDFCVLTGTIENHAKSTGRLDVDAEWADQVDDVARALPEDGVSDARRPGHSHVGDLEIGQDESPARVGRTTVRSNGLPVRHELRHQLGDTRHHLVRYTATATSRFREYFAPEVSTAVGDDGVLLTQQVQQVPTELHVPSSRRPDAPEVAYVVPTFTWEERTAVLPGRAGRGRLAEVLVPTTTRTRSSGLRVYLRRPWFSSGDGEVLGVVLRRQPWITWPLDAGAGLEIAAAVRAEADALAARVLDRGLVRARPAAGLDATARLLRGLGADAALPGDEVRRAALRTGVAEGLAGLVDDLSTLFPAQPVPAPASILTQWGADPAYVGPGPGGGPYIHQLSLRNGVVDTDAVPVEEPGARVTVVGHEPEFDPDRGLWFCDIGLPAGPAYTPFVRLALCRYQPWSVPGTQMSKVVRADFAQLLPPRTLTVRRLDGISVSLSGPAGSRGSETAPVARRARVRVESRRTGGSDLEWAPEGAPVELTPAVGPAGLGDVRWSGRITPLDPVRGTERRLVVEELESFPTDPDPDPPFEDVQDLRLGDFLRLTTRERLVFADHVPL